MPSSFEQGSEASSMPIAIVGIGLRFPGDGSDPERFWNMLLEARSARSEIPASRYSVDGFYHPDPDRLGVMSMRFTWKSKGLMLINC